jgi:hypothetical protein
MTQAPPDVQKRILFILHHGLAELRNRALEDDQQAADLADALEILPGMLLDWDEDRHETARWVLNDYQTKHPGQAFDYVKHLDEYPPPDRF